MMPDPLCDESGFPIPLLRVRDWVSGRGGTIQQVDDRTWRIEFPRRPDAVVTVGFDDFDGGVLLRVGDGKIYGLGADLAYTDADYAPWTGLEHELRTVLRETAS